MQLKKPKFWDKKKPNLISYLLLPFTSIIKLNNLLQSFALPKKSKFSKEFSMTFEVPGIYVYQCTPHNMMAMVGVIKVESSPNLETVKVQAQSYKKTFLMNQDRLDNYLSKI